jgi:hypothetical protein
MRALLLLTLQILAAAALADDGQVALPFEAGSSRLLASDASLLRALPEQRVGLQLVLLLPRVSGRSPARFVAARAASVDRRLSGLGLTALHQPGRLEGADAPLTLTWRIAPPDAAAAAAAERAPSAPPPATPGAVAEAPPRWSASAGSMLQTVLRQWGERAGWTVLWQSSVDYPLDAGVSLGGDFVAASTALLAGFAEAQPPPVAHLYLGNQVLIIR